MEKKGCVHLYTGAGKGKTTAAVGLCARAAGSGLRVGFCQLMKTGKSGEVPALEKLGVRVLSPEGAAGFIWQMDEAERAEYAARQQRTLREAMALAPALDLLALDEAVCAEDTGLLPAGTLAALIKEKPAGLELVLTGRGANEGLMALADYVTEMRMIAHPFEKGLKARRGIEF